MTAAHKATALGLSRFGLGARPGDRAAIGGDIREALRAEIAASHVPMPSGPDLADTRTCLQKLFAFQREEAERRQRMPTMPPQPAPMAAPMAAPMSADGKAASAAMSANSNMAMELPRRQVIAEVQSRFEAAMEPRVGFGERLAMFWSNHFAVALDKGQFIMATAGAYEREAIRPHVFGKFADLLVAVVKHPAMLFYLDNHLSTGPSSRFGRRAGLNENLAREILELHTLGVDGGYSQADVLALAKLITGWRFVGGQGVAPRIPGTFEFLLQAHEPGIHRLLGQDYADEGIARGERALRDLARHPSTARFIARKLARHFVADDPPARLIETLADVFRRTDGDLKALAYALIEAPEAWDEERRKLRLPQEFLVAAARLLGTVGRAPQLLNMLSAMGQPLWNPPGPNGYSDMTDIWANPEGIKTRMTVSMILGRAAGSKIDPRALAEDAFGPALHPDTAKAISRAESRAQGLAILLMSPEFQRR